MAKLASAGFLLLSPEQTSDCAPPPALAARIRAAVSPLMILVAVGACLVKCGFPFLSHEFIENKCKP